MTEPDPEGANPRDQSSDDTERTDPDGIPIREMPTIRDDSTHGMTRYRVWYRNHVPLTVRKLWCRLFGHHEWDDGIEWGCKRCDHYHIRNRSADTDAAQGGDHR